MTASSATAKTVLIANETPFVRDRFQAAVEGAGHRALPVQSAAELLARVRAELAHLDLVVLDLGLPPSAGLDAVRSIRRLDGGRLPILVFSGSVASAAEVRELAALGVVGYVNEFSAVDNILPSLAPHLFPETFNRRSSPRVVLGVPIAYRFGGAIAAALTLNLSRTGLAVRTTSPVARGAAVGLRFRLPGSTDDIDVEARVAWSDPRLGMGLHFERVDAAAQARIDEFVDAHLARPVN